MTIADVLIEQEWWEERFDSKCQNYQKMVDGAVPLPDDGFTEFDSIEDLEKYEEY